MSNILLIKHSHTHFLHFWHQTSSLWKFSPENVSVIVTIFRIILKTRQPYSTAVWTYSYRNDSQTSNTFITLMPVHYWHSLQTQIDAVITGANRALYPMQTLSVWGDRWKDKERRPLILIKDNELSPKIKRKKRVLNL